MTMPAMAPPDKAAEEFGMDVGMDEENERDVVSALEPVEAIGSSEGRPVNLELESELVADGRMDVDVDAFSTLSTGLSMSPVRGLSLAAL